MKMHSVVDGCSMWMEARTDRQTDMTKLTFTFHNFLNAPNNRTSVHI